MRKVSKILGQTRNSEFAVQGVHGPPENLPKNLAVATAIEWEEGK